MNQTLSWQELKSPVQYVKGIGPSRAKTLAKAGVNTCLDLLYYFPRTYQDRTQFSLIPFLKDGEVATVKARVVSVQETKPRPGLHLLKVIISDGRGRAEAVWFNQPFLKKQFASGQEVIFSGRVSRRFGPIQFSNPDWEILDEDKDPLHTGRIVPIYPLSGNLTQRAFRRKMKDIIDAYAPKVPEFLPPSFLAKFGLMPLNMALTQVHFPESQDYLKEARKRFIYEELFLLQLGFALRWKEKKTKGGISFKTEGPLTEKFLKSLPFKLTEGQAQALEEIKKDMRSPRPMNRLLQGEVGSGKTVIACYAMLVAVQNGYQAALMAPTEILAGQHFMVLEELLKDFSINLALITSGMRKNQREEMRGALKEGKIDIAVGTHALLQEEVSFKRLGLAVIDEQHRFGVMQRKILKEKGLSPDVLVLTATPIPRSLALTIYGDFDISTIRGLPVGRQPITTYLVNTSRAKDVYNFVRREIAKGRQAYIVCPLIGSEEDENLAAQAALKLKEGLEKEVFPDLHLGLLHGRMSHQEKEEVMRLFKDNQIQVLVSTSVIEVGIDVPNATVMVIWNAERFGLAQLHQLRGRVGRGSHKSYCILLADPKNEDALKRLDVMVRTNDGFLISAEDLKIRGPGEFFGLEQHGAPELKVTDLFSPETQKYLEDCREQAFFYAEEGQGLFRKFPLLSAMMEERFPFNSQFAEVG
ncbi:MAG: ATP-dependent DNA helicase RecG [Caldiserica bacterium]|nr:ATP-dependent DNA helicase RecG [Caldisericota bacterium]